ncbi:MAG TPA: class I SAM-dependent methyltransferase [Phycisphaerales bacterium]|nr:class I SAM-dependent methyltransferase [Phycisphaerales bacterium]
MDRYECYELCVQSARHVTAMLRGIHANEPTILREDFCGTAAVARRWCEEGGRAVGIDLDGDALDRAARLARNLNITDRLTLTRADCIATPPAPNDAADIVWVGNFSLGYIYDRPALIQYLCHTRERLLRGQGGFGGGVFVCDLYGGAGAFRLGSLDRTHMSRGPEVIKYHWEHEAADPVTGMVRNAISFRVIRDGELMAEWPRAFVYDWRLWSLPELRDAFAEAGYQRVAVYKELNVAPGQQPRPVESPGELGEDWVVMVAAWA